MGLFDKILKEVSEKAPDLKLDELAKNVSDAVSTLKTEAEKYAEDHKNAAGSVIPSEADGPKPGAFIVFFGTFGKAPAAYFKDIFLAEFPGYELAEEAGWGGPDRSWIFRFRKGGEDKLVVELLPENSSAVKLREKCRKQGLPYLRYYTNHEGWWNTRTYVVNRTRAALGD